MPRSIGCAVTAVTAVTEGDILLKKKANHTHPPDQHKIKLKTNLHATKENAKAQPFKNLKRIYEDAFGGAHVEDEEAVDALPSLKKYRQTLHRSRATRLPKLLHTRQDIALRGEWIQTTDGHPFLLADDGEEDRILIFETAQNIRHLCSANEIFMEGTFKAAPEMFAQVYSIHVKIMGTMMPMVAALLPNKDQVTHTRMIQLLQAAAH